MKTPRTNLLITLTVAFLTLLSFAPTYSGAQDKKPTLSKKELKVLLRTAKSLLSTGGSLITTGNRPSA